MRNLKELDKYRWVEAELDRYGVSGHSKQGVFVVPNPHMNTNVKRDDAILRVIADSGQGWDHVSVSLPDRCPTWDEMDYIKRLFFKDSESAMQLHVPNKDHINHHPFCLHLWRPMKGGIPRPDGWRV